MSSTGKKAERKKNADRMRRLREDRDRKKRCRTCGRKVAKSARTGKPAKLCSRHLGADMLRKLVYILPWLERRPRTAADVERMLCYPVPWRGYIPT